jgi:hypothetical protein
MKPAEPLAAWAQGERDARIVGHMMTTWQEHVAQGKGHGGVLGRGFALSHGAKGIRPTVSQRSSIRVPQGAWHSQEPYDSRH